VHALPGVGQNLQDHIDYVQSWTVPGSTASFGASLQGMGKIVKAMFEWRSQRTGMITSAIATGGAFFRSAPHVTVPDLQLVFVVALVDDHARKAHVRHGISCHVDVLRPFSRGTVGIRSADPRVAPVIDPQFLSDARDLQLLLKGGQVQQRIMESSAFSSVRGKMLYPVKTGDTQAMVEDIRNRADTQYHPVGSCKMGPDSDPMAVVDAQLRVKGIAGLRVADASIMPTLIGGNTNAPSIMIGEKCADLMRTGH
jgi:choline dehydrogenase